MMKRILLLLSFLAHTCWGEWSDSAVTKLHGHYPFIYCHMTNAMLQSSDGVFYVRGEKEVLSPCVSDHFEIWDMAADEQLSEYECTEIYDVGHVFTMYYFARNSNYYHLHLDLLFPLYKAIFGNKTSENLNHILMPSVESIRLQPIDWQTDAFKDKSKFWYSMVKYFAGDMPVVPLDQNFRDSGKNICFKNLYFGTPNIRHDESSLILNFAKYMKGQLNVDQDAWKKYKKPLIGIIARRNRRKITNEDELVRAVQSLGVVHLLKLENFSFKQQVETMQKYTVLVGMNGAGLMNGIYLPPHGVAIQLIPYQSQLNHKMYGEILAARGPYLSWENKREMHHHPVEGDRGNNRPDTHVHVGEFRELVMKALDLVSDARKELYKDEL